MCRPPEDELADTAHKQPLALTLGAAAVTLVVIIGVLSGPSVVYCFNAEEGMGQCLRGQMVNSGILPRPAVASAEPTTPAGTPAPVTPAANADIGETALDVAEPAAAASDPVVAATFGLLRAEPDGSVVIAGSGTPGSEVQVFANDDLLGTTKVEQSGDWVFVPATPLTPGELEITLGEAGKPGRATESIVVAINEDKTSEPLVVASTPGAPSEVLQGLRQDEPEQQQAAAEPETPPAQPAQSDLAVAQAPPAQADSADAAAPTSEPATSEAPILSEAPAAPVDDPEPQLATAPTPATQASPDQPAEAIAANVEPADVTPPPATLAMDATPPSIDAIEIEGDRTFFAGAGPEGADIRLYVDDVFISDAKVSDGRWLVEAGPVLGQPSQRVRIDMLQPGTAKVASRAEVNFVVDLPGQAPIAVAEAQPPITAAAEANSPPSSLIAQSPQATTSQPATPALEAPAPTAPEPVAPVPAAPALATAAPTAPAPAIPAPAVSVPLSATASATPPTPAAPAVPQAPVPQPTPSQSIAAAPSVPPANAQPTPPAPVAPVPAMPEIAQGSIPTATSDDSTMAVAPANSTVLEPRPTTTPPIGTPPGTPSSASQPAALEPEALDPAPATAAPAPITGAQAPSPPTIAPQVETTPTPEPAPASEPAAPSPEPATPAVTSQDTSPSQDMAAAPDAAPVSPAAEGAREPVAETTNDIPTMVAVAVGGPDAQRFASGKAIIRRGDNLWTIARRVYGQGVKYTTIYEANTGQIRNPDRIYPGQVFALPDNNQN